MSLQLSPIQGQSPDEEDLQDMIDDADEDESGTINFQEFVGLMLKSQTSGLTREDIKQVMMSLNICPTARSSLQYRYRVTFTSLGVQGVRQRRERLCLGRGATLRHG